MPSMTKYQWRRHHLPQPKALLMAYWRPAFPLLFIAALLIFENFIDVPSCVISGDDASPAAAAGPSNLKVLIVSDLLLKGSDAGYVDAIFRNTFFFRFFRKSYEKLEPDMFVVLGDIAATRAELKERNWSAVLKQFYRLIGPLGGVPIVVGLGERDIGECCDLDQVFVSKIADKVPGLDRTGCAAFKFENVSFVFINAVALLCNENDLRFGVEKLIESESFDLRTQFKDSVLQAGGSDEINKHSGRVFSWESNPPPGSGPVVMLHFPLHRAAESNYESSNIHGENLQSCELKGARHADHKSNIVEAAASHLLQALPLNETEYILQSLRPRIVFSAHKQHFHEYNHNDGTREVTVPAMTWTSSSRPGFVFVTFGENNSIRVSHCSLAGEKLVLMGCLSIILLVSVIVISRGSYLISLF